MFKAILCDDNELVAQGLGETLPWEELRIDFRGYCLDGLEARKLLEKESPDILITDIQMPFLDGLELTRIAKTRNPDTVVIIISGYNDFDFAQEALKLGVTDYLLKPIDPAEMEALLRKVVKGCEQRAAERAQSLLDEQTRRHEQIRTLIYDGPVAFENVCGREEKNRLRQFACMVGVMSIDNYEQLNLRMTEKEQQKINQVFLEMLKKYIPRFQVYERRPGTAVGYFLDSSPAQLKKMRESIMVTLRKAFGTLFPSNTVTFAGSSVRKSALELQKAHEEAMLALQERFVYPPGSNIFYDYVKTTGEVSAEELDNAALVSKLVALICQRDRSAVHATVAELQENLLKMGGAKSYIFMKIFTSGLFVSLFQDLGHYGIESADIDMEVSEEYQRITETQSLEKAMELLLHCAEKVMDAIENNAKNSNSKSIVAARNYIEEHYMDPGLTMDEVAREVHMSSSYFSVVFKRETGMPFTDYLIRHRIRKSQELMKYTDLRIYEISSKVGYDTAAYYSTAFKKETGLSPSEYKKKILGVEPKE
ncbi:MAG: response regulator [Lachnospiraceae bacterium]|nr:response regulator [Lachnospiraceae bacterium]